MSDYDIAITLPVVHDLVKEIVSRKALPGVGASSSSRHAELLLPSRARHDVFRLAFQPSSTATIMSLRPATRLLHFVIRQPLLRHIPRGSLALLPRTLVPRRWNSHLTASTPIPPPNPEREPVPSYQLTFTCRPCGNRSTHTVSKQAYHKGTVLIQCPGCTNRHLIADHLKVCPPDGGERKGLRK